MKKIALSIITTSVILTSSANAGMVIDVEAGAGIWQPTLSGTMGYGNETVRTQLDLEENLDMKDTSSDLDNNYIYIDVDHFVPVLPNIRFERLNYSTSGNALLTNSIKFGDESFSSGQNLKTDMDMVQNDFILYWGIPGLNIVTAGILDIDFGIMAKQLDGYYSLTADDGTQDKVDFDVTIPMGYLAAQIDIPFLPLSLEASTKVISYDSSEISDTMIKASLNLPIPLPLIDTKLDVGYREQILKIDPELIGNFDADIKAKGIFFGLSAKF